MDEIIKKLEALQCQIIDLDDLGALGTGEREVLCDLAFRLSALCSDEGGADDPASFAGEVTALNVTSIPAMRACQVLCALLRAGRAFTGIERALGMLRADQYSEKLVAHLGTAHAAAELRTSSPWERRCSQGRFPTAPG